MKQIVSKQIEQRSRREGKGHVLAISRKIYKLSNRNTFYVESETTDNRYYFVRFNPSVFEWCSCKDFESNRAEKCKHIYGVEFGIRFNTILEVEHLPEEVTKRKAINNKQRLSYESDQYDF